MQYARHIRHIRTLFGVLFGVSVLLFIEVTLISFYHPSRREYFPTMMMLHIFNILHSFHSAWVVPRELWHTRDPYKFSAESNLILDVFVRFLL